MLKRLFIIILASIVIVGFNNQAEAGLFNEIEKKTVKIVKEVKKAPQAAKETTTKVVNEVKKAPEATSKIIEKVGNAIEEAAMDIRDETKRTPNNINKVRENIANDWNRFREKKIDPIGDAIALAYYSFKNGCKDFPAGFGNMQPMRISNPDVSSTLSADFFNYLLGRLIEKSIPLDKDNPNSNNYFSLSGATITVDHDRQILIFKGSNGMLGLEAIDSKLRGGLRVNGFTIELFPNTRIENGRVYADILAKLVYLDLDDTPPLVERAIAHGVHREKFSKGPLASMDITNTIKASIPYMNREDAFSISLQDASLYFEKGSIIVEAKMKR